MKVYLATSGEYSDYGVCHAFSRREDAEAYPLGDDVLELEVHDGPVEVRFWYEMSWVPRWPDRESDGLTAANPYSARNSATSTGMSGMSATSGTARTRRTGRG